jgi:hypothetical protein
MAKIIKVVNMKISRVLTLSSYGDKADKGIGIGHTVNGKPPQNPSFAETMSPIHFMIDAFKSLPTGTKIKVTMETVKGE